METYLSTRKNLYEVVLLVDIRHEPTADDKMMYDWIKHYGYGSIVVATKSDKISKGAYQKHFKMIREKLEMEPEDKLIPISSLKRQGIDKLWDSIEDIFKANNLEITMEEAPE